MLKINFLTAVKRRRCCRCHLARLVSLMFAAGCMFAAHAAVTVTDENGVVYDILSGTDVQVSINNASVFKDKTVAVIIPAEVTDHATTATDRETIYHVTAIAPQAFRGTSITSVSIEAPVPAIPQEAFRECYSLASVAFPSTVTSIGRSAFQSSYAITDVVGTSGLEEIGAEAFSGCSSLTAIALPEGLTSLGEEAFYSCTSLEAVTFPSTLVEIPGEAFSCCYSLKTVTFSAGNRIVGNQAFYSCSELADVQLQEGMEIGYMAFASCSSIGTLTLYKGMTLGSSAFASSGVQEIIWPEEPLMLEGGVFSSSRRLTSVTIPGWMTSIPDYTFSQTSALQEVVLNAGVEVIGESCFSYYTTSPSYTSVLAKVSFAPGQTNTLKKVSTSAFRYAKSLTEFPFTENLEICDYSFQKCGFTYSRCRQGCRWVTTHSRTIHSAPSFGRSSP